MKIKKFNEELDIDYLKNYFNETVYYLYGVNGKSTTQLEVGTLEDCIETYKNDLKEQCNDDYIIIKETREILPEALIASKYNI